MLDLTRQERFIIIFLISGLLLGSGIIAYRRTHSDIELEIKKIRIENEKIDELIKRSKMVNINEAGIEGLMRLKGIGRVLAGRIIDYRSQKGPFKSKEEIKNIKGLGEKLFEGIKDDITIE